MKKYTIRLDWLIENFEGFAKSKEMEEHELESKINDIVQFEGLNCLESHGDTYLGGYGIRYWNEYTVEIDLDKYQLETKLEEILEEYYFINISVKKRISIIARAKEVLSDFIGETMMIKELPGTDELRAMIETDKYVIDDGERMFDEIGCGYDLAIENESWTFVEDNGVFASLEFDIIEINEEDIGETLIKVIGLQ